MKIEVTRPHALPPATLRERIAARVTHYAERHPALNLAAHYRWASDTEARGSYRGGDGALHIGPDEVRVTLQLPFFARPFRARIEDFLRREADLILGA